MRWRPCGLFMLVVVAVALVARGAQPPTTRAAGGLEEVRIIAPERAYKVGRVEVFGHFDPNRRLFAPRLPLMAPKGTVNLALHKTVTSLSKETTGLVEQITDGIKEADEGKWVDVGEGFQWVQIDLGRSSIIYGIVVWHQHGWPVVYRDVIVQVSEDRDFIEGVHTIFNNDHDNSSGMGRGEDYEYLESHEGALLKAPEGGIKGRYVRLHSRGTTGLDDANHYIEVEVYGVQR